MTGNRLEFTILGCGSSGGVPRVGGVWGDCDPENPRNRRRRCALLIRRIGANGQTTVLIDTGPDVREQLLDAAVSTLDAVVYTHAHADHIHGIDDLRALAISGKARVPVYLDETTSNRAHDAFGYCFVTPPGSSYPPILDERRIEAGTPFQVVGAGGPIEILPIEVDHGDMRALGFRIADLAYLPDVNQLPASALEALEGLDIWIVDALRKQPHPSHFSLNEALAWIRRLKPRRAVLTNMHIDLDYSFLRDTLPRGVEPAYDGMQFTFDIS